ncbi:uncharacterized protein RBU33_010655 [Hipposideros larvatus]
MSLRFSPSKPRVLPVSTALPERAVSAAGQRQGYSSQPQTQRLAQRRCARSSHKNRNKLPAVKNRENSQRRAWICGFSSEIRKPGRTGRTGLNWSCSHLPVICGTEHQVRVNKSRCVDQRTEAQRGKVTCSESHSMSPSTRRCRRGGGGSGFGRRCAEATGAGVLASWPAPPPHNGLCAEGLSSTSVLLRLRCLQSPPACRCDGGTSR